LRGGQGAQFYLPMLENINIVEVIDNFAGNTYATTLDGDSLYAQDLTKPTAFVIGNEGAGLTKAAIQATSHQLSIPMNPQLESLNATVAAAICLFERKRQTADKF
jgi:TrmH family RNA methyltransferase